MHKKGPKIGSAPSREKAFVSSPNSLVFVAVSGFILFSVLELNMSTQPSPPSSLINRVRHFCPSCRLYRLLCCSVCPWWLLQLGLLSRWHSTHLREHYSLQCRGRMLEDVHGVRHCMFLSVHVLFFCVAPLIVVFSIFPFSRPFHSPLPHCSVFPSVTRTFHAQLISPTPTIKFVWRPAPPAPPLILLSLPSPPLFVSSTATAAISALSKEP